MCVFFCFLTLKKSTKKKPKVDLAPKIKKHTTKIKINTVILNFKEKGKNEKRKEENDV